MKIKIFALNVELVIDIIVIDEKSSSIIFNSRVYFIAESSTTTATLAHTEHATPDERESL